MRITRKWIWRIGCLALCFVCLAMSVPGAGALFAPAVRTVEQAVSETAASQTYVCKIRRYASISSNDIGSMENGTVITVLGSYGSFYKIDCYDMTGYILKSQVVHNDDGSYAISCDPQSSETEILTYTPHAEALQLRHSLLSLAQKQLGTPYVYGGTRPGGFDCSGLMYYLYGQHGISLLRTASNQLSNGIIVSREGMQVGDLVFFREPDETNYPVSHVGIYAGNNQVIHSGGKGVEYAELKGHYYGTYFLCARRIICTQTAGGQQTAGGVLDILPDGGISGRKPN